jgi:PAS domain S-box-containing protein
VILEAVGADNAEKVQDALYRIAELASAAQDMQEFYRAIHEIVGELMYAENFFIALHDEERGLTNWPYFVDERREDVFPDPSQWLPFDESSSLTGYVLRTGAPQHLSGERIQALVEGGETAIHGDMSEDWLGVPLKAEERTVGVLVVQSYTPENGYTEQDKELLAFVGQHVGAALSRARAIEETRERNAELAVINSVQTALAGELEMQAIYDVVGDKIQEIFDAQAVLIMTVDEATGLMHFPYLTDRGGRQHEDPAPLTGFTKHVLETREPLLVNGAAAVAEASEKVGSETIGSNELPKSLLFVPLLMGDRAAGVISLQNMDREHAFDDADQRLLTTLTGDLSVALENARLVQETRQRNAELALINSVQSALAGELEMQAIYDVVGDKIQEIFDAQVVDIGIFDFASGLIHYPYAIERGVRYPDEPRSIEQSVTTAELLETKSPLVIDDVNAWYAERGLPQQVIQGEPALSMLAAPLITGDELRGRISLQNLDRTNAFTENDVRLLTTLASSLSVALENARLLHETRQRNAELALINSVQDALAGELELQAIYDAVGDRVREVFDAQAVEIDIFDEATGLMYAPYNIERGVRYFPQPAEPAGFTGHVLATRETVLVNEHVAEVAKQYGSWVATGEAPKSVLFVPLVAGGKATGAISLQNIDREHAFGESDRQLLETLAGSLSVALENARLVHETRQRNAELALINSVQDALAGELELQAIYDAVGDRIRDVFDAEVVDIAMYDETSGLIHFPYAIERGERSPDEPIELMGFRRHAIEARESLRIDENLAEAAERYGNPVLSGEMPKSLLYVPLVTGGKATGVISLQSIAREHAFSDSDQQLLETLAGSLSVALENARLVHETRQRNAELALINSVQDAIAGELDDQAIYDAVGEKIREIFDAQAVQINVRDETSGLMHFPYLIERGERLQADPQPPGGFTSYVLETRQSLLLAENLVSESERYGAKIPAGEVPKSVLFVPLLEGGNAVGTISLQNVDREHAFGESDRQLLETLAGSLSVALENARLVHETRQRNAELALINSVQDAIAGELDQQAIYDAVGDRIQEIFDAQVVAIRTLDDTTGLVRSPYIIERGERLQEEPISPAGFTKHVLETRESVRVVEDLAVEMERRGSPVLSGEAPKSVVFVPLVVGGKATGVISLQNVDREHAFSDSDQQLLETLAGSLSVALENARLVDETRQRNAELALINSVQDAIAGELDQQAIYDAVGDRIREVFDAQGVQIVTLNEATGLMDYPYCIERGERQHVDSIPPAGFSGHVLETRESVLITENVASEMARVGSYVLAGDAPKSILFVPLVSGGRATGVLSLQNADREHAFGPSDLQLLETLAGSLSVALENARLVHETRQRNAELALINGVQDAIAGELDQQAIYDAVGDKIQEVFDAQAVMIVMIEEATGQAVVPYAIERGERQEWEPQTPSGLMKHVIGTRETLLINEDFVEAAARLGSDLRVVGKPPKSVLFVPLVIGGRATGALSLQNVDREHAFGESDQQLLETLAGSLSVALENARLVHETRQRNAELALINSVQAAIAGELDPQAIYDLVGDRLQEVFDAQVVDIGIYDETSGQIHFPYVLERGERFEVQPLPLVGFRRHVLETLQPLLVEDRWNELAEQYGNPLVLNGEPPKSALFVPLIVGGRATGVVSLQNVDRTHAYAAHDQRLLTTLAGSLSVALENARLVHETRQRVSELATVNSVGQALSSQLDLDALIELVGEQVRDTFDADIAYVALHDEAAGRIEFAYYYESGERRPEAPLEYGHGLTSQIIESREPLLLNRREQLQGQATVGTPSLSYLGVPILVGSKAIGAVSVQSIEEEGRFGEADARLLATIAANVGVAIQNARLFTEVEHQKQYFEMLVEVSPAAIVVMDADERVTGWNPAAAALFGYSPHEAIGSTIDELVVPEEFRSESRNVTTEALEQGRTHRITRRTRKDGGLVDVEMELLTLRLGADNAGFYAIYHDITELQRARQEAEAATQAKSAFLATMSHEIRTPMNAVIGMTDLLLGTDLTAEQREFAEVVHSSGDALLHVIDDILDYSKIEAGKLDLERAPFSLRDCVEGALDIVAPRAWEKELELGCLIDEGAPAGIVGDEARLRQVLLNLLSNAVKFTESGEVVVLVDAEETDPGSYAVELAVRDTGIGIPADRMDQLFTSFSQVDASTTRRFGGTGLGLAISKRLVELMGGTISVDSEEERGSTFRISLPVQSAEVPTRFVFGDGLPHLAGKRILVVDDNATNREIVTRHARSWGMEPVAVELPAAALELVADGEQFDVAVLDMMMPEMDGLALAGEIRRHRSESELPLLLLTSLGRMPQLQSKGLFSAQLAKPLKASQLYNTLLQLLTAGGTGDEEVETVTDGKRSRSALRILLAEDNAMNQKVALRLLERLGYRADVATNGLEAIEALELQPYDVVLMDVQMPELDGLDATRRICERWPADSRPHIIAMTANALPEDREACFAAGMNDYVAKPIRAEELAAALKRARPLGNGAAGSAAVDFVNLDDGALKNLRDLGGDDFLGEVIDAFLADAPGLVATLRRSLEEGSAEELRRAAHTLKSNGATLGAEGFADLCRTLEQRAKAGELDGAQELVDRIEQEYRPLEDALTALRTEPVS